MSTCEVCGQEMTDRSVTTCPANSEVEFPDGATLPGVPFAPAPDEPQRCDDCGIAPGGFHHPGCDMEDCPRCGGQLLTCACRDGFDDDEDEGEGDVDESEDDVDTPHG